MAISLFKKRKAKSKTEDVFNRPLTDVEKAGIEYNLCSFGSEGGRFNASPITPPCENQTQPDIRMDKITPCDIVTALIQVLPPDQAQSLVNNVVDLAKTYGEIERRKTNGSLQNAWADLYLHRQYDEAISNRCCENEKEE